MSKTKSAAKVESAEVTTTPSVFTANIAYIKDGLTKNGTEYVMVVAKSRDDKVIEDTHVALFLPEGTIASGGFGVGDLIAFRSKALVEDPSKPRELKDGTKVYSPVQLDPEFSIKLVAKKRVRAEIKETGNIESPGLMARLGQLLGLKA